MVERCSTLLFPPSGWQVAGIPPANLSPFYTHPFSLCGTSRGCSSKLMLETKHREASYVIQTCHHFTHIDP